jgi:hypothetical protein
MAEADAITLLPDVNGFVRGLKRHHCRKQPLIERTTYDHTRDTIIFRWEYIVHLIASSPADFLK